MATTTHTRRIFRLYGGPLDGTEVLIESAVEGAVLVFGMTRYGGTGTWVEAPIELAESTAIYRHHNGRRLIYQPPRQIPQHKEVE